VQLNDIVPVVFDKSMPLFMYVLYIQVQM